MTAIGKPTYEELEKKCALLQSKLAAMNELMNVVGKASDIVNVGVAELQSQKAELEARAVNLPKRSVGEVMHMSGFSRDYAEDGVPVMTTLFTKSAPLALA